MQKNCESDDLQRLTRLRKSRGGRNQLSSGAKARRIFKDLMARVNSCPSKSGAKSEFSRSLYAQ